MRVLMNSDYFIVLPKADQAARTLMVYLLKSLYKKELKRCRMVTTKRKFSEDEIGVLSKRTI